MRERLRERKRDWEIEAEKRKKYNTTRELYAVRGKIDGEIESERNLEKKTVYYDITQKCISYRDTEYLKSVIKKYKATETKQKKRIFFCNFWERKQ